jgi:hypothetical protein
MQNRAIILLVALATTFGGPAFAEGIAVAIAVHPDTQISNLSMEQLRKIFLADQQFWPDKTRITLLVKAPGAIERDLVLDRIYMMNEMEFRKYWIAKMFRAEVPSGPKLVFSSNMALELVTAIRSSITFLNANEISDSIKVLRIDGYLPNEQGYPLRTD